MHMQEVGRSNESGMLFGVCDEAIAPSMGGGGIVSLEQSALLSSHWHATRLPVSLPVRSTDVGQHRFFFFSETAKCSTASVE